MILVIILLIVFIVAITLIRNKVLIRFDTFFRKGFTKYDDKYGVYCFCRKARRPAKQ